MLQLTAMFIFTHLLLVLSNGAEVGLHLGILSL